MEQTAHTVSIINSLMSNGDNSSFHSSPEIQSTFPTTTYSYSNITFERVFFTEIGLNSISNWLQWVANWNSNSLSLSKIMYLGWWHQHYFHKQSCLNELMSLHGGPSAVHTNYGRNFFNLQYTHRLVFNSDTHKF